MFHPILIFSSSSQLFLWTWYFVVWSHHRNWICIKTIILRQHHHLCGYMWMILYIQLPYILQKNLKIIINIFISFNIDMINTWCNRISRYIILETTLVIVNMLGFNSINRSIPWLNHIYWYIFLGLLDQVFNPMINENYKCHTNIIPDHL